VQLFAVAYRYPAVGEPEVAQAVEEVAGAFAEPRGLTVERGSSESGRLAYAAVAHRPERAAPRVYLARSGGDVLFYDGLPLPRDGQFNSHDASALLARWRALPDLLEGVFSIVRLDLLAERVECMPDVLGMAKVFVTRRGDGFVLANSVDVVRLLTGASTPDALGVSSMLGFGWAAGGHTLLDGVRLLEGGRVHDLTEGTETPILSAESVAPSNNRSRRSAADVAQALVTTARAVPRFSPVTCGLTAGRDTRVLVALALAAGIEADYYTSGRESDVDVVIARELADAFGLHHDLVTPRLPDDWDAATSAFSTQTDGLASLWIVSDWIEHQGGSGPVGLKLWGPGGEVGRAGNIGLSIPFGATTPVLRTSVGVQRWILGRKIAEFGGLVTPEATATTRTYLDRFIDERLGEGWRAREVSEAYYGFERVRYWASAGVRRASAASDLWSPFVSRDFIEYCWSLTPEERTVEAPHWKLLSALDRRLRDFRFEYPWRAQRPRLAAVMVGRDVARAAMRRRRPPAGSAPSFGSEWIEAGLAQLREVVGSLENADVWNFVDRDRLQQLLHGPREAREASAEGLCRAITVLWWLHGRHASSVAPGR
jgi:asparagine synthase (glutamine-hydrolysing)